MVNNRAEYISGILSCIFCLSLLNEKERVDALFEGDWLQSAFEGLVWL